MHRRTQSGMNPKPRPPFGFRGSGIHLPQTDPFFLFHKKSKPGTIGGPPHVEYYRVGRQTGDRHGRTFFDPDKGEAIQVKRSIRGQGIRIENASGKSNFIPGQPLQRDEPFQPQLEEELPRRIDHGKGQPRRPRQLDDLRGGFAVLYILNSIDSLTPTAQ